MKNSRNRFLDTMGRLLARSGVSMGSTRVLQDLRSQWNRTNLQQRDFDNAVNNLVTFEAIRLGIQGGQSARLIRRQPMKGSGPGSEDGFWKDTIFAMERMRHFSEQRANRTRHPGSRPQ